MVNPFIGSIQYFAFNYAPKGWVQCTGQLLPIAQNQALFALLGTTYGGDGVVTLGLPDFRGRAAVGTGTSSASGAIYTIGENGGAESASMNITQMPAHTHPSPILKVAADTSGASNSDATNEVPSVPDNRGTMYAATATGNSYLGNPAVTVSTVGGGTPFSTLSPFLALNCCIALTGYFPSRNS